MTCSHQTLHYYIIKENMYMEIFIEVSGNPKIVSVVLEVATLWRPSCELTITHFDSCAVTL